MIELALFKLNLKQQSQKLLTMEQKLPEGSLLLDLLN